MKQSLLAVVAALALWAPVTASAGPVPIAYNFSPSDLGISAAVLSGAPCATIRVGAFSTVAFYISLTRAATTTLTATCQAGPSSSLLAPVPVATVTSSKVSLAQPSPTFSYDAVTTGGLYRFLVSPLADDTLKCCFGGAGATSDTISAYARGVAQQ